VRSAPEARTRWPSSTWRHNPLVYLNHLAHEHRMTAVIEPSQRIVDCQGDLPSPLTISPTPENAESRLLGQGHDPSVIDPRAMAFVGDSAADV
jgi:hypothetical protein